MLERINYRGWQNSYRIFNPTVELVVLADVGPRIISYGFQNGENVLHEVPEHAGITGGREFRLYGGIVCGDGRSSRAPISPTIFRLLFPRTAIPCVSRRLWRTRLLEMDYKSNSEFNWKTEVCE